MAKQNKAKAQSNEKSWAKVKRTVVEERSDDLAGLAKLPGGPVVAAGGGAIQAQAAQLGDPRWQSVQRQALAAEIGRVQGNRHLQRVVASVKGETKTAPYPSHTPEPRSPLQVMSPAADLIQLTPLRYEGPETGIYEFLTQTRDRFARFSGVQMGRINGNSLEFGQRNYRLDPISDEESEETISARLGEGVFFLESVPAGGVTGLGGGVYNVRGVNARGGLDPTSLQVRMRGLSAISEGILAYSARVHHLPEVTITARPPADTEALARQIAERLSGTGRLTAPGVVGSVILGMLRDARLTNDEMMDILQRLERAGQIAHFLEFVRFPWFRQFLRAKGVSWQYVFMNWEAGFNDFGAIFAGFVVGAGETVEEAVRLVYVLVGANFSRELAMEGAQFILAIERFFEQPIESLQSFYETFVNHLWNLELFEAGRIMGLAAVLLLTLPAAIRSIPRLATAVARVSVRTIRTTLGVSREALLRFAREPRARVDLPEGQVLMSSGDDIVVVGREGQTGRISRQAVLSEAGAEATGTRAGAAAAETEATGARAGAVAAEEATGARTGAAATETATGAEATGARAGATAAGTATGAEATGARAGATAAGTEATGARAGAGGAAPRPAQPDVRAFAAPDAAVPSHLARFQQTIRTTFDGLLGGRSTRYRIAICDDATRHAVSDPRYNPTPIGQQVMDAGGALTDTHAHIIWVHQNVVQRGGLIRSWGSRLNLRQVIAHEMGHAAGNPTCPLASRYGSRAAGLTRAERIGLLDDAVQYLRDQTRPDIPLDSLNLPSNYTPPPPPTPP